MGKSLTDADRLAECSDGEFQFLVTGTVAGADYDAVIPRRKTVRNVELKAPRFVAAYRICTDRSPRPLVP